MLFSQDAAFVIPATSGDPSPVAVVIAPPVVVAQITVAFSDALPAGGSIVVAALKASGDPAVAADYLDVATLTAPGTVTLADIGGARIFGRSGGTAGTVNVTVTATRSADLVALDGRYYPQTTSDSRFLRTAAGLETTQAVQGIVAVAGTLDDIGNAGNPPATAYYASTGFAAYDDVDPNTAAEYDYYGVSVNFGFDLAFSMGDTLMQYAAGGDTVNGGAHPDSQPPAFGFFRSRGTSYFATPSAPTGLHAGDVVGRFVFSGYNDVDVFGINVAFIQATATEDWTSGGHEGIGFDFYATRNNDGLNARLTQALRGEGLYLFPATTPLEPSLGGGLGVAHVGRASTIPTAAPAVGCLLYVDPADDKLKAWRAGAVAPTVITA